MPRVCFSTILLVLGLLGSAGCSFPSLLIQPVSSSPELQETVVAGGSKRAKVAMIEVEGMLANTRAGGGLLGAEENKVSLLQQELNVAASDDRVKVVLLRINSPGGTVGASETMYNAVRRFKEQTGKPVIVQCQDITASGGYYVACAADEIYAQQSSLVGSIGVIFEVFTAKNALDKLGVSVTTLKSGKFKDIGSPFKALGDDERAVMQGIIDDFFAQFTGVVTGAREVADTETAFDGRVFTGDQAFELGLTDGVQSLPETIERARALAGRSDAQVVMYRRPYGYTGSIYASSPMTSTPAAEASPQMWMAAAQHRAEDNGWLLRPGLYYLWRP